MKQIKNTKAMQIKICPIINAEIKLNAMYICADTNEAIADAARDADIVSPDANKYSLPIKYFAK